MTHARACKVALGELDGVPIDHYGFAVLQAAMVMAKAHITVSVRELRTVARS